MKKTQLFLSYAILAIGALSAAFLVYGKAIHDLSPAQSIECAAQEINSAVTNGTNLLTKKCDYLASHPIKG